jgi:outer membrane protein assembly factor BamA
MQRSDVVLDSNERDSLLNITFNIREKGRQGIYFTGGSAGVGGGSIGILYNVFNLLRIGETLSLKLDGGASQSNAILNIAGTHFLGTPFSLGLSIFHTTTGFNVANIMPGLDDIWEPGPV